MIINISIIKLSFFPIYLLHILFIYLFMLSSSTLIISFLFYYFIVIYIFLLFILFYSSCFGLLYRNYPCILIILFFLPFGNSLSYWLTLQNLFVTYINNLSLQFYSTLNRVKVSQNISLTLKAARGSAWRANVSPTRTFQKLKVIFLTIRYKITSESSHRSRWDLVSDHDSEWPWSLAYV